MNQFRECQLCFIEDFNETKAATSFLKPELQCGNPNHMSFNEFPVNFSMNRPNTSCSSSQNYGFEVSSDFLLELDDFVALGAQILLKQSWFGHQLIPEIGAR